MTTVFVANYCTQATCEAENDDGDGWSLDWSAVPQLAAVSFTPTGAWLEDLKEDVREETLEGIDELSPEVEWREETGLRANTALRYWSYELWVKLDEDDTFTCEAELVVWEVGAP